MLKSIWSQLTDIFAPTVDWLWPNIASWPAFFPSDLCILLGLLLAVVLAVLAPVLSKLEEAFEVFYLALNTLSFNCPPFGELQFDSSSSGTIDMALSRFTSSVFTSINTSSSTLSIRFRFDDCIVLLSTIALFLFESASTFNFYEARIYNSWVLSTDDSYCYFISCLNSSRFFIA